MNGYVLLVNNQRGCRKLTCLSMARAKTGKWRSWLLKGTGRAPRPCPTVFLYAQRVSTTALTIASRESLNGEPDIDLSTPILHRRETVALRSKLLYTSVKSFVVGKHRVWTRIRRSPVGHNGFWGEKKYVPLLDVYRRAAWKTTVDPNFSSMLT